MAADSFEWVVADSFRWFRMVSGGFRWFRLVCCFSSYELAGTFIQSMSSRLEKSPCLLVTKYLTLILFSYSRNRKKLGE